MSGSRRAHHVAPRGHAVLLLAGLLVAGTLGACRTVPGSAAAARRAPVQASSADPRACAIWDGRSGDRLSWDGLLADALVADVVILGEQHDDALGHAVQRALVEDLGALAPDIAVALEMLERNEQGLVDDYLDGFIDAAQLARLTHSESWAGEGSWAAWYQPVIDAAKEAGGAVIAANAPRQYVRAARLHGYERLADLPPERRALVDWPDELPMESGYRERFFEFGGAESDDDERVTAIFRSQMTWDATMAESVAGAVRRGHRPVVLLIGQFHSDFEGGTVLELRRRFPGVRIFTVSLQPGRGEGLEAADENRADAVIDTGTKGGA